MNNYAGMGGWDLPSASEGCIGNCWLWGHPGTLGPDLGACLFYWPSPASSCTSWCFPTCWRLDARHLFLLACGFGSFEPVSVVLKSQNFFYSFSVHLFESSCIPQVMAAALFFSFLELKVSHRDEQRTYAVLNCVISKEIWETSWCSTVVHTLRSWLLLSDVKSCCWQ